jgi:2-polyprenyl-6-hydroxyphenyl methylase/3-demethylubiquinone-9 3-methyltransferase
MIATQHHEAEVAFRFDLLQQRFKRSVAPDDPRLRGIIDYLGPWQGYRVLDLGCGKGRFSRALQALGASVFGIDLSAAMLAEAEGLARVRATARRLPFGAATFDRVIAVEVFEHLEPACLDRVLGEIRRVLRPEGSLAVVDKNVASLNAQRPWLPNLAVKWIDQHRGLWMYPGKGSVREHWFWPFGLQRCLQRWFSEVQVVHLLSPAEQERAVFRLLPGTRLMTLWTARAPGGRHA